MKSLRFLLTFSFIMTLISSALAPAAAVAAPSAPDSPERFIVVAKTDADYDGLRDQVTRMGGKVTSEGRGARMLVAYMPPSTAAQVKVSGLAEGVAKDHVVHLIQPNQQAEMGFNSAPTRDRFEVDASGMAKKAPEPDPAMSLPGLMWDFDRLKVTRAWRVSTGSPDVVVGVADTGLDYTHSELAKKVMQVVDFTKDENPPLCKTFFTPAKSDADWAAEFGGPPDTDWNGHGSWIGGNIAAALDGQGVNGIAPKVGLVALKISQWCGSAYDSTILNAFLYAADHAIDIVSISFGGYLDLTDPDQALIYKQYVQTVNYARRKGTLIVASAGNEHLRIGMGGKVISHGPLTIPGDPFTDFYGLYQNPGGIPGVIDVSSTGNVNEAASATCPAGTTGGNATCKPATDAHQPIKPGSTNQLAYYSNYGPRIDIGAPGGARKFNLPNADRGGTPGFPYTAADGTTAYETFGITSNWALEIPCFVFSNGPFYPNECYTSIQGTSMAAPHVSAVLALIASRNPYARHKPMLLTTILKLGANRDVKNFTPPLSATDLTPGDRTGIDCLTGFCHLGGEAISNRDAYGAGLVNAFGIMRFDDGPAPGNIDGVDFVNLIYVPIANQ
jgi:subtilisin family serine protease